jgi:hypothetical protein
MSYHRIVWASPSFRACPGNIFKRIFDFACLAMEAIGRIDYQLPFPLWVFFYLVNFSRAEQGARVAIPLKALGFTNKCVMNNKMTGLVLFVLGSGEINTG